MKRFLIWVILLLLAGAGFWATWGFFQSPYYALYQIGKSIHNRQPRLFLAYVDVKSVVSGQRESLVEELVPGDDKGVARQLVGGLMSALMPQVVELVKDRVVRVILDPERENLPTSWALVTAATVTSKDDYALVVLGEPQGGRRLRLGMRRQAEEDQWRVVEINPQDLKALVKDYLKDKYPPKKKEQPAKTE
ncbi:MAG: DUF2939 domain-containing protein [Desulfarculaceae bacterium]|jgi:hypothetical protein